MNQRKHYRKNGRYIKTRLFRAWDNMRSRCKYLSYPSFHRYGGRGIKICEEWNIFESFWFWAKANGYKRHLWLDRKDNNKGYSPENCRWVTPQESGQNRNAVKLTPFDIRKIRTDRRSVRTIAAEYGVHRNTIFRVQTKIRWNNI